MKQRDLQGRKLIRSLIALPARQVIRGWATMRVWLHFFLARGTADVKMQHTMILPKQPAPPVLLEEMS
jgi:hypothetical protein